MQRYYTDGMMANGRALEGLAPDHVDRVARIYTHQASPRLIHGFLARSGLPIEKVPRNCERLGNLVSVSTLRLLDEDLAQPVAFDRATSSVSPWSAPGPSAARSS